MDIRPIRTQADYELALLETEKLWNAKKGTPKGYKLDILITLIEAYEDAHDPIGIPLDVLLQAPVLIK